MSPAGFDRSAAPLAMFSSPGFSTAAWGKPKQLRGSSWPFSLTSGVKPFRSAAEGVTRGLRTTKAALMGGSVSKESITVHSCHPFPLGQGPVDEAHKWLWAYYEGLKEMMVYSPSPESAEIEQAAMLTLLEEALHDWGRLDDQAANTAHAAMAYSQALDALATAVKRTLEVREEAGMRLFGEGPSDGFLLCPHVILMMCRVVEVHATYVLLKTQGKVGDEEVRALRAGRRRIAAVLEERVDAGAKTPSNAVVADIGAAVSDYLNALEVLMRRLPPNNFEIVWSPGKHIGFWSRVWWRWFAWCLWHAQERFEKAHHALMMAKVTSPEGKLWKQYTSAVELVCVGLRRLSKHLRDDAKGAK